MALQKSIRQEDGVTTEYHRILYIMQTLNRYTSVAVLSYVDSGSRATENANCRPYQKAATYEFDYVDNLTPEAAYNLLKNLPDFEGAEDV